MTIKIHECIEILRCRGEDCEVFLHYFHIPNYRNKVTGKIEEPNHRPWRAQACNPNAAVCLGEIDGVYRGTGFSETEAVENLLKDIKSGVKSDRSEIQ